MRIIIIKFYTFAIRRIDSDRMLVNDFPAEKEG